MTRILVYGPEATRTRYVARLCATILGIQGPYDGHGDVGNEHHFVAHRSLPYGGRDNFPRLADLVPELRIERCVQTCRGREETIASAARTHWEGDVSRARTAWGRARQEMRWTCVPTFVFSSDAVETIGLDIMVGHLAWFLEAEAPTTYEAWAEATPR